jgi:uncharacterized protein (TIGR03437 family)
VLLVTFLVLGALLAPAQAQEWRKVGGSAVDLGLAAPATGPVDRVWFSPDGTALYAGTHSGRVFETRDLETWTPSASPAQPNLLADAVPARMPEAGAHVLANWNHTALFALGQQLLRSTDDGHSWDNLTAFRGTAVIGPGQKGLALRPGDGEQLVVANGFGVWRSMDAGLSWSGLNEFLPNLTIKRILSTPNGSAGMRVEADGMGVLELPPGTAVWRQTGSSQASDAALLAKYSAALGTEITAQGQSGDLVFAGAADGRIWASVDGGKQFNPTQTPPGTAGRVERIFVEATQQGSVALAALSGKGPHVLRTTNKGNFWDSLDGNLPDASAYGVAGDRAAGAVYVATDKGIFWTTTDLETASGTAVNWTGLSEKLPAVPAHDVRLDPAGVTLYGALDGYGIYAIAAPHRQRSIRVVNAADFSSRPAAPGSLLSVIGARVDRAHGGDLNYPVLAVLGNESQIQVPFEAAGPNVALSLDMAGGTVKRDIAVQPVSPAILVSRDGAPMLWDADTGLALDVRNAARPNGRIQIWATGLGRVKPDWPTGTPAQMENPPAVVANVRAFLDGAPVTVTRATLLPGYIGFYLIEVQLPAITNAGTSQLYISADGQESNRVVLVIEP